MVELIKYASNSIFIENPSAPIVELLEFTVFMPDPVLNSAEFSRETYCPGCQSIIFQ